MKLKTSFLLLLPFLCAPAMAESTNLFEISIANHRFEPTELAIPANTKIRLTVHNKDNTVEEFHSDDLHREKIIGANKSGIVVLGPLPPGVYTFMGEFHAATAQGRLIVQ
jgi:hypothetical protein